MTEIEYTLRVKQANEQHAEQIAAIARKFAEERNPYEYGDVIALENGVAEIISIEYGFRGNLPECWYEVQMLDEDRTIRRIWQSE